MPNRPNGCYCSGARRCAERAFAPGVIKAFIRWGRPDGNEVGGLFVFACVRLALAPLRRDPIKGMV